GGRAGREGPRQERGGGGGMARRQDVGPADPPLAIALGRQPCDAGGGDDRVRRGGGQRPVQFRAGQRDDGGGPHTSLTQPLLDQRTFDAAARLGKQDQRGAAVGGA